MIDTAAASKDKTAAMRDLATHAHDGRPAKITGWLKMSIQRIKTARLRRAARTRYSRSGPARTPTNAKPT
jgi:hypothetical protein